MRGLAYKRFQREKHIKKKENIIRKWRPDNPPHKYNDKNTFTLKRVRPFKKLDLSEGNWHPYYIVNYRGEFNKGKIHCSCPLCSPKTNILFCGTYKRLGNKNYSIKDLKRYMAMIDELNNI